MNCLLSVSGAGEEERMSNITLLSPVTTKKLCTSRYATHAFHASNRATRLPRGIRLFESTATGKPRGRAERVVHINHLLPLKLNSPISD